MKFCCEEMGTLMEFYDIQSIIDLKKKSSQRVCFETASHLRHVELGKQYIFFTITLYCELAYLEVETKCS